MSTTTTTAVPFAATITGAIDPLATVKVMRASLKDAGVESIPTKKADVIAAVNEYNESNMEAFADGVEILEKANLPVDAPTVDASTDEKKAPQLSAQMTIPADIEKLAIARGHGRIPPFNFSKMSSLPQVLARHVVLSLAIAPAVVVDEAGELVELSEEEAAEGLKTSAAAMELAYLNCWLAICDTANSDRPGDNPQWEAVREAAELQWMTGQNARRYHKQAPTSANAGSKAKNGTYAKSVKQAAAQVLYDTDREALASNYWEARHFSASRNELYSVTFAAPEPTDNDADTDVAPQ